MARRNTITKCICHDRTFEKIKAHAAKKNYSTVEELQEGDYCCNNCGLCAPYVEMMLETGETEFNPGDPFRKKRNR
jgi:bacterioferritin-associated ferredoxin